MTLRPTARWQALTTRERLSVHMVTRLPRMTSVAAEGTRQVRFGAASATLEVKLAARALSARSWSRRIDVGETLISGSSFVCGRVNRNARPKNGRTDESQSLVATDPSHDCGERLLTPTRVRAAPQTDGNVE